MKKKIFLATLFSLLLGVAVGCGGGKGNEPSPRPDNSSSSEVSSEVSSEENESSETQSEESDEISSEESSAESENSETSDEEGGETEECVVTFDTDGGSSVDPVQVKKGEKISPPDSPEKSSKDREYEFLGWFYNGEAWDFETDTVEENITLVAHWKEGDQYTKPFLPKD